MAYTLIGGTAIGTVLILLFLPALYAAWFRIKPLKKDDAHTESTINQTSPPHHAAAAVAVE
jgi:hypothetical protein